MPYENVSQTASEAVYNIVVDSNLLFNVEYNIPEWIKGAPLRNIQYGPNDWPGVFIIKKPATLVNIKDFDIPEIAAKEIGELNPQSNYVYKFKSTLKTPVKIYIQKTKPTSLPSETINLSEGFWSYTFPKGYPIDVTHYNRRSGEQRRVMITPLSSADVGFYINSILNSAPHSFSKSRKRKTRKMRKLNMRKTRSRK
jgi:hypothetical protein